MTFSRATVGTVIVLLAAMLLSGTSVSAVVSYGGLADALDKSGAARAVGSAVAANPVSYLIPCHRVIRKSGHFHNYYWGPERKRAMLAWEAAHFALAS